jgi:hypothetical protein
MGLVPILKAAFASFTVEPRYHPSLNLMWENSFSHRLNIPVLGFTKISFLSVPIE